MQTWMDGLLENYPITMGDTSYMRKNITLSTNN